MKVLFIIFFALLLASILSTTYGWLGDDSNGDVYAEQQRLDQYVTCYSCCMSLCEANAGNNCSSECDGYCR